MVAASCTTALSFASTSAAPPTNDPATAGEYAAGWLARQLDADIPLINFGSPDWGVTLDAAISLAATGTGGTQLDAVWAALVADRDRRVLQDRTVAIHRNHGRVVKQQLLHVGRTPRTGFWHYCIATHDGMRRCERRAR